MTAHNKTSERVVVIGSGPGGAAAAACLADAGIETLVMEAGSERSALGFTARLRGFTFAKQRPPLRQRPDVVPVGDPKTQIYEELAPGGLSNHWSCAVPRFSAEDFSDAMRAGEAHTWPIAYDDLSPWYDRLEPVLRIAGGTSASARLPAGKNRDTWHLAREWDPVASAAQATGRSVVVMPYANGATTLFTRAATAFNAFVQLVLPRVRRGELSIVYDAQALRLEWSAAERRVVAVVYREARSGREIREPCRAVVIAAGALNSAQILLQSRSSEFPNGLGNEHDVLGRYLHDHPLAKVVFEIPRPVPIHPASYVTRSALEHCEPLYAAACMQWCGAPALARSVLDGHPGRSRKLGFSIFGTMEPNREDFVKLASGRDDGGGPSRILVSLKHPDQAKATLERTRDDLLQILRTAGWEPRIHDWTIEPPGNSVHYGGTCRMHHSPRFGVVDAFCRVHGVSNVAVADSSVFTTSPEKNPVLTSMALAARTADRIATDIHQGSL